MTSIGHIKKTETNPHSPVNFQTGKIKVLFTIDVGAGQSGETRFLSGIFFNSYQQCFLSLIIQ
jgi:hypothetical protein